jgi:hypothetical protein
VFNTVAHALTCPSNFISNPRRDAVLLNNHGSTQPTGVKYFIWDASFLAFLSKPLRWFKDWFSGEDPSPVKGQELITNSIEGEASECYFFRKHDGERKEMSEWEEPTPNAFRLHALL